MSSNKCCTYSCNLSDKKTSVLEHPRAAQIAHSPEDDTWYEYEKKGTDIDEFILNAIDLTEEFKAQLAA